MIAPDALTEDWRHLPTVAKKELLQRLRKQNPEITAREKARRNVELARCRESCEYWIQNYAYIYNATVKAWIPFDLWDAQKETLAEMEAERLLIVLKARQLGLSWLTLAYILWVMLFHPAATMLMFSKRDDEAKELLNRLKGMYKPLPRWMQADAVMVSNEHDWELSNGSSAKSLPTTGGRSYTATIVLVDEADFVQDLNSMMNAVQPTIDAGGKMIMISTVDKEKPESYFKQIYRGARDGLTEWRAVFLPWWARPGRTQEWYERKRAETLAHTAALDDLYQEYPATDIEALAPNSKDKRIPAEWLAACFEDMRPIEPDGSPAINGLAIYHAPSTLHTYVIGADPAEGNPTSDDSALTVLCVETGEEVASLAGKFQPSTLAAHADTLASYYNRASIMVERNNHGHSVILWLTENSMMGVLVGLDNKYGWLSSSLGKSRMYDQAADTFREMAKIKSKILHTFATSNQLASIEGSTLRAPDGQMDDLADSYALAEVGRQIAGSAGSEMRQGRVKGREGGAMVVKSVRRSY